MDDQVKEGRGSMPGENARAHRIFIGTAERKRPLRRERCRWDNIKTDRREIRMQGRRNWGTCIHGSKSPDYKNISLFLESLSNY